MANKNNKKPTYGELSNIATKLKLQEEAIKLKFPNDEVKVNHVYPDGTKTNLGEVTKQLNAIRNSAGVKTTTKTVNKVYRPSSDK